MRRSVRLYGSRGLGFACLGLIVAAGATLPAQQQIVPGTNVNMVSGTKFPDGDPYLQRQNEPSSAVSTRNPLHILGGANDYRTVDIPNSARHAPNALDEFGCLAWLVQVAGRRAELDEHPLARVPDRIRRARRRCGAMSRDRSGDQAGTNGMFYYGGLVFNRGENAPSAIFVARFMDMNNLEAGDPVVHLDTRIVDSDAGTRFLDKTALATDIPRTAATCTFNVPLGMAGAPSPQTIPAGNVYVAYSAFLRHW